MSNSNKATAAVTPVTPTSKFSIVRSICALLNLGEEGKLESFLDKVVKQLKKEITVVKKNQDTAVFLHEQTLEELNDKLVDAQDALKDSYLSVNVDAIQTKEQQNSYIDTYLSRIDAKKAAVLAIEAKIEQVTEAYNKKAEASEAEIKSLQERLDTIAKG
jgi:ClpP class serine protease